jgi:1,2-phenylacetyl-CoA epoxidase PaaB subunit
VRWSNGIKLDTATKENLKEYIATKCYKYIKRKINDDNL